MSGKKESNGRCCALVRGEGSWGSFHPHQCRRKIKVEREGRGYCATHDPVAVKEKDDQRRQKWQREWEEKQQKHQQQLTDATALEHFRTALEAIREGHNDPRAVARKVLAKFPAR